MNITNLLNFQSIAYQGAQTQSNELNKFVANSIRIIVEEFFLTMVHSFIIVVSCRRSSPLFFYLNILQHLFNMVDNMIVQLVFVNIEKPQIRIEGPRLYNLLLVDSLEAFIDIDINSYTHNSDTYEYYHIFLMQRDRYVPNNMESIFQYCWTHNIINCNIQTQNGLGEVYMYTYFPYTPTHCGHTKPEKINQFVNDAWKKKNYFLPKLNNFHGCPLVAVVRHIPPYFNVIKNDGKIVAYSGFEMSLVRHLSKRMNFTLDIRESRYEGRSYIPGKGPLQMVVTNILNKRKAHFALGFFHKISLLSSKYTTTFPHYQNNIVTVIYLKAQTFGTFEILYYPFKVYAWSAIIVFSILTILVTRFVRETYPCSMTTFSIIACGFGLPVNEQPKLYHSSLIFITWLWCTFILRLMYSALLYHLFTNDVYRSLPHGLEHAFEQKYRAVMNRYTLNDIKSVPYYEQYLQYLGIIYNSSDELIALTYLEENTKENLLAVISKDFLIYYAETYRKSGLFYIIPDIILQQQFCIYMGKHSFLTHKFDTEIINIQSVGLMELWSKRYVNAKYFKSTHLHVDEVICQNNLWGIYMICAACQLIALFVFIAEILSIKYRFLKKLFK